VYMYSLLGIMIYVRQFSAKEVKEYFAWFVLININYDKNSLLSHMQNFEIWIQIFIVKSPNLHA